MPKAKTLTIKILTSCAGEDFTYDAGKQVDAPEARALDLLNAGYAEAVVVTPARRKQSTRVTKAQEMR